MTSLALIDANSDAPIAGLNPIPANATIRLSSLPSQNLSIRAFTSPATVGSVRFVLTGPNTYRQTENVVPYVIGGDTNGNIQPMSPALAPGSYTLQATAYTGSQLSGTAGPTVTIPFTVVQ